MSPYFDMHPTFKFLKAMGCNSIAPTAYHKNKGKTDGLMNEYYVVRVIAITCLGFGVIINIISKDDSSYHVTIDDISHCTCPYFTKVS